MHTFSLKNVFQNLGTLLFAGISSQEVRSSAFDHSAGCVGTCSIHISFVQAYDTFITQTI